MGLTSGLVELAVRIIDKLGYAGVFVLMTLESMVAPVPSEGVMPFAGFLAFHGELAFWPVVAVATAGSLLGSWISYEMGKYLGRPVVIKWGRYVFLSERDLDWAERFFHRAGGEWAIFIGRFVPVVRHVISLPAGLAKMPLVPFFIATGLGAFGWNLILTYAGFKLAENWERIKEWMEPVDYAILALMAIAAVVFVWLHWRRFKQERASRIRAESGG